MGPRISSVCAAIFFVAVGPAPGRARGQNFSQTETQTKPSTQAALIDQANDALAKRDYAAALKLLTDLNTQSPNEPHILFNLGFAEDALDQPAAAEADYRKSIAADATFAEPHIALGLLLARDGRTAEARPELIAAAKLPGGSLALRARALRALARIDLTGTPATATLPPAKPDVPLASAELLEALKLTPETPDDILFAAELAEASAALPAAEQAYRRYLALPENANEPHATAALGHILLAEHHAAEAEALLAPAVAQHPGDPTLTAQLAAADLDAGDPEHIAHASTLLEDLHRAHPEDAAIGRMLARVYVETGRLEQADPLYAALISAQSQNGKHADPTLLDDRAEVLIRMHRPGEAETLLKLAVADPAAFPTPQAYGDATTHLAFAASEIDDPKLTLRALTLRATVLQPSPSTLFLEATANDSLHQSTKAAGLYKEFLALANGQFPNQELQARHRLAELEHQK